MNNEKILVTAALPYANGPIHLGHLAGAYLPSDIYVRYKRLNNADVLFICGSDEHGVPITITADKQKVSPQKVVDKFHEDNLKAFEKFGMSFDIYSRTTHKLHHQTAKEFFLKYYNEDMLNRKQTRQFFDEKAKMFLPDRYVEGTCPNCGYENARSDECESCGALYDPQELKNPVSKISGERPVFKETTHWYFPLGDFQPGLEEYINAMNEKYNWKDNVMQYCRGWFKDGLRDRAYTRDLDWGVPVPLDDAAGKVIYVWFEAVLGYISATKELSEKKGEPEMWKDYWQNEKTKYVAFIGKDNVVFHCIIFPAMLMGWNEHSKEKYILPQNVPANEYLNFEGMKFSKSRNWGVYVKDFLEKFDADALRYTLAVTLPESRDTDFYWKDFQARHNNELADILGNFVNRTMIFVNKHFNGKVPPLHELEDKDSEMLNLLEKYPDKIGALYEKYKIRDAVAETMNLGRAANKYFNDSEPWKTVKEDKEKCATTLNICVQTIYTLAELLLPVIPNTSEKMFKMLNADATEWSNAGKYILDEGHKLGKAEILFKKIDDSVIDKIVEELHSEKKKKQEEEITIDDFMKVKLKTAEVIGAEKIKKSNKLLKLRVDTGEDKRQVIAGIAKHYKPEELIGKKVIVVANLKPAKLMGQESQGMILAVEKEDGSLQILEADKDVKNGTRAK